MEGSLLLPDLGCVLFSISCQAEQEKQTIADELEHGNGKRRRQWANSEVRLNLVPGNAALSQPPGGKRDIFSEGLKDKHGFQVPRTEVWGQARLWVVWSGASLFSPPEAVSSAPGEWLLPGQLMVMRFSGKVSLQPRAEAHCHWLRSRGVHAGDVKILIELLNTWQGKLWSAHLRFWFTPGSSYLPRICETFY